MRAIGNTLKNVRARSIASLSAAVCALVLLFPVVNQILGDGHERQLASAFAQNAFAQETGPMAGAAPRDEGMPVTPSIPRTQPAPARPASATTGASQQRPSTSAISTDTPAIPVDQIIQQFAAHEAEFKTERDNFTYTQTFTIQTIGDGGVPDGEYTMTSDITFSQDGKRNENVTYAPAPTLERIQLTQQDFADLENVQPFVLTTVDLPKYNVTYVGRQAVDTLGTYVFDVAPKTLEKNQRYFQGRIWVDDRDLEIVKTDGKAVPDIRKGGSENVFPRFETFRENIEGHYWFPTYTRSDDVLQFKTGDVKIHMSIRYTDYKRFRVGVRLLPTPQTK